MSVIVPLHGVVQGRGGLVLGSVIPCALFYFLLLYLKRHRSDPSRPPPPADTAAPEESGLNSAVEGSSGLHRSLSRGLLSLRGAGGPAYVSSRANSVARSGGSPELAAEEDSYHRKRNPYGVIELGLEANKLSLDLI